jgi:hypothetical protein
MSLFDDSKAQVSNLLAIRSMQRHRSRLGWRFAPAYSRYWRRCRSKFEGAPPLAGALAETVANFRHDGIAAFSTPETEHVATAMYEKITQREAIGEKMWAVELGDSGNLNYAGEVWRDFPEIEELFRGPLGMFLMHFFESHFKIFHGILYKSISTDLPPGGSQRWHSDSGPGSCVNVMFYLHPTGAGDGALEALPWDASLTIFERERKALRAERKALPPGSTKIEIRKLITDFYTRVVAEEYADRARQPVGPAGLVVPFFNNNLHRGGFPDKGRTRYAAIFHCYPSDRPADFARYRREGVPKTASYPKDPAAVF